MHNFHSSFFHFRYHQSVFRVHHTGGLFSQPQSRSIKQIRINVNFQVSKNSSQSILIHIVRQIFSNLPTKKTKSKPQDKHN
jgi:hypothetical protein